ncbi:unnamed protein product [Rotaria sp. Silwood2]|nr:unnamed protein product [Rotaria sp. Silwood2]CAF4294957.1 unnamed protein product [Rotaria sp. Silwood2]
MYSLQIIPLVYVLLTGKNTDDYNSLFEQLLLHYVYEPESVLVDLESATLKSTKTMFPEATQIEVQSLGLQNKYTNDDKFRINVKKLMGLAFVPVGDVLKAYSSLINDFDDEDYLLLDYFERVWVGQKKSSRRGKPRFSLQLWNIYDRVIQDLSRSNNAIEGWHHAFNTSVSIKHPSITKLAKCILRVQARFEIDIE